MPALSIYFFAVHCALGAVLPLMTLALAARGLRPSQYGLLMMLIPLSRVLTPPLWGALADRFLGTSRLMGAGAAVCALAMLGLASLQNLWALSVAFVGWALFSAPLVSLAVATAHHELGPERSARFAYIRVWGSVGFAASAMGLGWLGTDQALQRPFWVAAGALCVASLCGTLAPSAPASERPVWREVGRIWRQPRAALLWLGTMVYYLAHGIFDVYFGPVAVAVEGVDQDDVSLMWALGVVVEVFVVLMAPRLLAWLRADALLVAGALLATLRWLWLSQADTALEVWVQQPLHGVTFGLWYLAFIHATDRLAPRHLRATVQGFGSTAMGTGMVAGNLMGGLVLEHLGGASLFRVAAASASLGLVLYVVRARVAPVTVDA